MSFVKHRYIFLLMFPVTKLVANVYGYKKALITHKAPVHVQGSK